MFRLNLRLWEKWPVIPSRDVRNVPVIPPRDVRNVPVSAHLGSVSGRFNADLMGFPDIRLLARVPEVYLHIVAISAPFARFCSLPPGL